MVSTLSSHFHTWARGWLILAIIAAFVAFAALILPGVQEASGDTQGLDGPRQGPQPCPNQGPPGARQDGAEGRIPADMAPGQQP